MPKPYYLLDGKPIYSSDLVSLIETAKHKLFNDPQISQVIIHDSQLYKIIIEKHYGN